MSGGGLADPGKLKTRRRGIKLCILVSESNSCRSAYRFLKAFLLPALDQLHLVTAISSESGRGAALARQRELLEAELMDCSQHHVVLKEEEYTLYESLGRYITTAVRPHIIFMGSTNLCTSIPAGGAMSRMGQPGSTGAQGLRRAPSLNRQGAAGTASAAAAPASTSSSPSGVGLLGSSCLALRVLPELRCAPVLLAKYNSKGSWLTAFSATSASAATISPTLFPLRPGSSVSRSTSINTSGGAAANGGAAAASWVPATATAAMRVMVDLQPNSRHVLDWLFEHFTAGRDHLVLTVSQAFDDQHNIKPTAQRLLTAFGVQAAVNSFEADKAVLAGPVNKSLPQAVMEAEPDVLVLQAPRCRGLPSTIVELLYSAKTSFLIWPPDYKPPQ